ncbi:MAG TPA: TIGR01777 family oxidoreductase [Desulfomonilaceae bacterium]|nr:TIGR01777 family oxidoreductase [Desulfomonilaceae bacterium]
MKIFMTGGYGFVGSALTRFLLDKGHEITSLIRGETKAKLLPPKVAWVSGDPNTEGTWQASVAGHDVLINLAGATIFQRWTPQYKKLLRDSRILTTRHLVEAIPRDEASRVTLISTSAVGYYGPTGDEELGENAPAGSDFLAHLALDWEIEALKAEQKGARVVITRFGVVFGKEGGALQQMILPFRFFMGGPLGDGHQWFSWIHIQDLCRGAAHVIENADLRGPVNFTAPVPVRNRDLVRAIGNQLRRPSFMPAPGFMIRLIFGEFGSVLLAGQRVVPRLLMSRGFQFSYPDVKSALADILRD